MCGVSTVLLVNLVVVEEHLEFQNASNVGKNSLNEKDSCLFVAIAMTKQNKIVCDS